MGIGHGGNLRKMGNTDNLVIARKPSQLFRHLPGRLSADSRVNLIKHQRIRIVLIRKNRLKGKHNPGQFAAAGNLPEGLYRLTGICGNHKLHLVIAVR